MKARKPPRLALLAAALAAAALFGFAPGPAAAQGSVWVGVHGQRDGEAPEELVLEIGQTAWLGYGGVASVDTAQPVRVRLVGRDSCRIYADFVALPATMWVVRFAEDGSTRLENWTARGMEAGPALPPRPPSGCPDATTTAEPQQSSVARAPTTEEQQSSVAPTTTTGPQPSSVAPGTDQVGLVMAGVAILVVVVLGAGALALTRRT